MFLQHQNRCRVASYEITEPLTNDIKTLSPTNANKQNRAAKNFWIPSGPSIDDFWSRKSEHEWKSRCSRETSDAKLFWLVHSWSILIVSVSVGWNNFYANSDSVSGSPSIAVKFARSFWRTSWRKCWENENKKHLHEALEWRKVNKNRSQHAKHALNEFQLIFATLWWEFFLAGIKLRKGSWNVFKPWNLPLLELNETKLQLILIDKTFHHIPSRRSRWSENPLRIHVESFRNEIF